MPMNIAIDGPVGAGKSLSLIHIYAQANPRMGAVERAEHGQKKAVQRGFARADGDHAALQAAVAGQLLLARLNLFTGDGNARKQLFALRREHRAAVAAHKERTAERRFQIADCLLYTSVSPVFMSMKKKKAAS